MDSLQRENNLLRAQLAAALEAGATAIGHYRTAPLAGAEETLVGTLGRDLAAGAGESVIVGHLADRRIAPCAAPGSQFRISKLSSWTTPSMRPDIRPVFAVIAAYKYISSGSVIWYITCGICRLGLHVQEHCG